MKAKEVRDKYDISSNTLCSWVKRGLIEVEITPSGRYVYGRKVDKYAKIEDKQRKNIIYSRVSTSTQKDNLQRQIERIKLYCSSKGIIIQDIYEEIASALNYNRIKYRKLLKEITEKSIDTVYIEYKDRLLRIGFEEFEYICSLFGTKIVIIDESNDNKNKQQEITQDLISIIHHYSMKIYSSRKRKKIEELIKNENN
jgi:putative resolvase